MRVEITKFNANGDITVKDIIYYDGKVWVEYEEEMDDPFNDMKMMLDVGAIIMNEDEDN